MRTSLEIMLEDALYLLRQGKLNDLPDYLLRSLADALDRVIKIGEEKDE